MPSFNDKLKSSGLTPADAKKLGIVSLTAKQFATLHPKSTPPVPAMKLQYYGIDGKLRKSIWRSRVLADQIGAFGEVSSLRYLQNKGTPPAAYFPRSIDWKKVARDPTQCIVITEGELKAACACKHGIPCIGLGGVWSWRSKDKGWSFLPELERFVWRERETVICYDSDATTNPHIASAALALQRELRNRGAQAAVTTIPEPTDGSKAGIDDYIIAHGPDALDKVLNAAPSDSFATRMWEYNARYAFIREPDIIYDELKDMKLNAHRCHSSGLANETVVKMVGEKMTHSVAIKEWIAWPQRRSLDRFTYLPGRPHIVRNDDDTGDDYNTWRGWGAEPKKGNIKPWLALLDFVMTGATKEERRWFEQWLAYPFQHPGAKMHSACCFWSTEQGVGKSLLGTIIGDCYGDNFSEIPQSVFEDSFTQWGVGKQLVMVDDVRNIGIKEKRDHAARLKTLITQATFKVNIKYVAGYTLPDCINYILTSNSSDALLLDPTDRRFFVHHIPESIQHDDWYTRITNWREDPSKKGIAALLHHLMYEVKLHPKFKPATRPPVSEAKIDMINAALADHERWALDLRNDPDETLGQYKSGDLYTSGDLHKRYAIEHGGFVSKQALGVALTKVGFERRTVCVSGKTTKKLIAVCNRKKWKGTPSVQWSKHYIKCNSKEWVKA